MDFWPGIVVCQEINLNSWLSLQPLWKLSAWQEMQVDVGVNPPAFCTELTATLPRSRITDRQTESDACEPTMQYAQAGSKINGRWIDRRVRYQYKILTEVIKGIQGNPIPPPPLLQHGTKTNYQVRSWEILVIDLVASIHLSIHLSVCLSILSRLNLRFQLLIW